MLVDIDQDANSRSEPPKMLAGFAVWLKVGDANRQHPFKVLVEQWAGILVFNIQSIPLIEEHCSLAFSGKVVQRIGNFFVWRVFQ